MSTQIRTVASAFTGCDSLLTSCDFREDFRTEDAGCIDAPVSISTGSCQRYDDVNGDVFLFFSALNLSRYKFN